MVLNCAVTTSAQAGTGLLENGLKRRMDAGPHRHVEPRAPENSVRHERPNVRPVHTIAPRGQNAGESRRRCGRVPVQMWASPGADAGQAPAQMWASPGADAGESRRRCGRVPAQMWGKRRRRCGRVPAKMWASPGEDVGESRRRCGRVPAQMWASPGAGCNGECRWVRDSTSTKRQAHLRSSTSLRDKSSIDDSSISSLRRTDSITVSTSDRDPL
jgi:hypothetical protein